MATPMKPVRKRRRRARRWRRRFTRRLKKETSFWLRRRLRGVSPCTSTQGGALSVSRLGCFEADLAATFGLGDSQRSACGGARRPQRAKSAHVARPRRSSPPAVPSCKSSASGGPCWISFHHLSERFIPRLKGIARAGMRGWSANFAGWAP